MVKSVNKDWNPVWKHGQILRTTFFCGIFYECGGGVADTIFHRDHLSSSYSFSILKIAFPNFPLSSLFNPIFSHNKSYPSPEYFFKDFDRTLNMRFHHHHHSLTMGLFFISSPGQGSLEVLSIFFKHFLVNFKSWNYQGQSMYCFISSQGMMFQCPKKIQTVQRQSYVYILVFWGFIWDSYHLEIPDLHNYTTIWI